MVCQNQSAVLAFRSAMMLAGWLLHFESHKQHAASRIMDHGDEEDAMRPPPVQIHSVKLGLPFL